MRTQPHRPLILLTTLLLLLALPAQAGEWAIIDGGNADRVHLRQDPSTSAPSLGLYYTGTPAQCQTAPGAEWTIVTIGSQTGHMKSEFLHRGATPTAVTSRQPTAQTTLDTTLRAEPSAQAAALAALPAGTSLTILGETVTRWSYVRANDLQGYLPSEHLREGPPQRLHETRLYTQAPNKASSVHIEYPWFPGDAYAGVNAQVYALVQSLASLDPDYFDETTIVTMAYESAVTLHTDTMVSLILWGWGDVQGSAHPFTALLSLNIDLQTLRPVTLADLYTTDAAFEQAFFDHARFPSAPVTSYDAASFPEMLRGHAEERRSLSPFGTPGAALCFLKPDGIVLSLPAVHATGSDHFEAQLDYADLQRFYRPSIRYWE